MFMAVKKFYYHFLLQDTFLPHVENGTITLIGATTENPSFSLNNALLSRCRVILLDKLSSENIKKILYRAVEFLGGQVTSSNSKNEIEERYKISSNYNICIKLRASIHNMVCSVQNG